MEPTDSKNYSTVPSGAKPTLVKNDAFFTKKRFGFIFTEEKKIKEAYKEVTKVEDLLSPGNSACLGCHAELALLRSSILILDSEHDQLSPTPMMQAVVRNRPERTL